MAIIAEMEGKVAPSHTPIKALTIMTIQGNSLMSAAIVERGKSKLDNKKEKLCGRSVHSVRFYHKYCHFCPTFRDKIDESFDFA